MIGRKIKCPKARNYELEQKILTISYLWRKSLGG
jgi:hypothetical protein